MSIVAPERPGDQSSDPRHPSGFRTWFLNLWAAIDAILVRLGVLEADTGWVNLTGSSGVTMVNCAVRKVGRLVEFRAEFHTVTAGSLLAAALAVEFRPPTRQQEIALRYASTTSANFASVAFNTDGAVLVSVTGTPVTTTPGYTVRAHWTN